jgi:hypothetical protein
MTLFCRNLHRTNLSRALLRRTLALGLGVFLALAALAHAQTWTPLTHQPSFSASVALLLTDGTVMVQAYESGVWWRLTPDNTGSYINGTWTQLASLPNGYTPLFFASAVLPDGRVVVEGGEYNGGSTAVNSTLGAIYNPATNTWVSITPPVGVTHIGDASSVILANGTFMMGPCCSQTDYLLNPSTLTWTATGSAGKADVNSEEGWTLLPNGKVLTVDTENGLNSELYDPATGSWSSAGSTTVQLPFPPPGSVPEVGPAVLRPDGTVFATGGTSNIAVYDSASGTWSSRTPFPSGLDVEDGPGALLPNGNVLVETSPGVFEPPSSFFEFDGTNANAVSGPPRASLDPSFVGRMLVLPTGQILFTDGSTDVEIYTASGTYQSAWRPTISSVPSSVVPGGTSYFLSGTQLNGLSQGAMYGDDAQAATNYPLVRITNNATNHVTYAKTYSHSTMGVATGSALVSTLFDVPAGIETGPSRLEVVANGIPSTAVSIQVAGAIDYVGTLDVASCSTLAGWGADRNRLNTPITLSFYRDGALFTSVLANLSRPDVGAYLGDNGLHGFSFATPSSLLDGISHSLSVRFESSGTNLGGSPVTLTCNATPAAPSGLTASYSSITHQFTLNWVDNSNNEQGFVAQFSYSGSAFSDLTGTIGANVTSYTSAPNPPIGTYQFRVRAFNGSLNSGYSNVASLLVANPSNGAGYIGCYTDGSTRALPVQLGGTTNTIESCKQAAFNGGYKYAGLQFGGYCFAGNTLGYALAPESDCNVACTANSLELCGGAWRNSVYNTGYVPTPPTTSIAWIKTAESSWGPAGTLTAAGYAANGSGGVTLVWRERSSAGVWGSWNTDAWAPPPSADTTWSNTISSGNPTNKCHWFDAYTVYSGVTSATFHYTGAPGCP